MSGCDSSSNESAPDLMLGAFGFEVDEHGYVFREERLVSCCVCGTVLTSSNIGGVFKGKDDIELCCKALICLDEIYRNEKT